MRAAVIEGDGDKKRVVMRGDVPEPAAKPGEVVVRVRAAGLNRADISMNLSHGSSGGAPVPGIEFAGEVASLGEGVTGVAAGDRVMSNGASSFAEYVASDHRKLLRVPEGFDWNTAASIPVALMTMHDAVVTNGRLAKGESVLFVGATSGVGILGIQIAKAMGAGTVIGASRSDEKLAALRQFGMDAGVNITDPKWPEKVVALTGGKGADVIVDMVAGETVDGSMEAAALLGRIVNVGRLGGRTGSVNFDTHARKRLSYIGVTFRTRSSDEVAAIAQLAERDLMAAIAAKRIGLPIVEAFPLERIADAFAAMRRNEHLGKIVITL